MILPGYYNGRRIRPGKDENMCGRFLMNEEAFDMMEQIARIPSWIQPELYFKTIYPTNPALTLSLDHGILTASVHSFGYKSESMNRLLINARAETVSEKPMFRQAFRHSRCLVPASLFYEWDAAKEKISFFKKDQPVLYLAAILKEDSFIILTTEANSSVSKYHHRMPLVVRQDQIDHWLSDEKKALQILRETPQNLDHAFEFEQNSLF